VSVGDGVAVGTGVGAAVGAGVAVGVSQGELTLTMLDGPLSFEPSQPVTAIAAECGLPSAGQGKVICPCKFEPASTWLFRSAKDPPLKPQ
jgi:hypothetical protein